MPAKQKRYEVYSDEVMSACPSNFRLWQLIRELEKDFLETPENSDLMTILGIALFRCGRVNEGLTHLRVAAFCSQTYSCVSNYIFALQQNQDYVKAYQEELRFQHVVEIKQLNGAVLAREYSGSPLSTGESLPDTIKKQIAMIEKAGLSDSLSDIFTTLFEQGEYGWGYGITPDVEGGDVIVDIEVTIPATVDDIAKKSLDFSQILSSKYNAYDLMRIVPQFRISA